MLALERAARALGRGIWRDPFYAVRSAETAGDWLGGFELVEGRVHAVGRGGGKVYLNFAADWRQDFTATLGRPAQKLFAEQGLDLAALDGKRLRVRGWLQSYHGQTGRAASRERVCQYVAITGVDGRFKKKKRL